VPVIKQSVGADGEEEARVVKTRFFPPDKSGLRFK
jgi:hypothetical protein